MEDIFTLNHDTVRVRLQGGVHDLGRVKLSEAADMVRGVREMFFAGAVTVERRQPVFQGRSTQRVEDYMDSLEIAAPEKGSFVVKVLAPIPRELDHYARVDKSGPEDPFSRQATSNMLQAVDATIVAAKEAKAKSNLDLFKDHVSEGVTANLCEALTHVSGSSPLVSVSVGATWSTLKPSRLETPRRTIVPADLLPLIEKAAPILRGRRPEDPITVVGLVFLLKEEKKRGSQAVGIENRTTTGPRKVRVALSHGQYKRAIEAHGVDALVRVVGQVKRRGPLSFIDEPLEFEVMGSLPSTGEPERMGTSRRLDSFGAKK
jgi:hypothetical protein